MVRLTFRRMVHDGKLEHVAEVRTSDMNLLKYLRRRLEKVYDNVDMHFAGSDTWLRIVIEKYDEPNLSYVEIDAERLIRKVRSFVEEWHELKKLEGTYTVDIPLEKKEE